MRCTCLWIHVIRSWKEICWSQYWLQIIWRSSWYLVTLISRMCTILSCIFVSNSDESACIEPEDYTGMFTKLMQCSLMSTMDLFKPTPITIILMSRLNSSSIWQTLLQWVMVKEWRQLYSSLTSECWSPFSWTINSSSNGKDVQVGTFVDQALGHCAKTKDAKCRLDAINRNIWAYLRLLNGREQMVMVCDLHCLLASCGALNGEKEEMGKKKD